MYTTLFLVGLCLVWLGGFMIGRGYYRAKWLKTLALARNLAVAVEKSAESIGEVLEGLHECNLDLKKQNLALADRVAAQSELLSKAADREKSRPAPRCEVTRRGKRCDRPAEWFIRGFGQVCSQCEQAMGDQVRGLSYPQIREPLPEPRVVVEDPLSPTWAREVEVLEERG